MYVDWKDMNTERFFVVVFVQLFDNKALMDAIGCELPRMQYNSLQSRDVDLSSSVAARGECLTCYIPLSLFMQITVMISNE